MNRIIPVTAKSEIPEEYQNNPIGLLIEYHNLGKTQTSYNRAELLVGMCMDNRKHLTIPDNFAYIIRSGGANLRYSEFKVSYAIAVGQVKHIVLIAHSNCGMVNLVSRKDEFINGLVDIAGWDFERAEEHFNQFAPMFEIDSEIDFVLSETNRLRMKYPNITIAPLYYKVENNKLYFIKESLKKWQ